MGAFKELGKVELNEKKNVVLSKTGDGKFVMAQQLQVNDGSNKPLNIFLKNSIMMDIEGLKRLHEMMAEVIKAEK